MVSETGFKLPFNDVLYIRYCADIIQKSEEKPMLELPTAHSLLHVKVCATH